MYINVLVFLRFTHIAVDFNIRILLVKVHEYRHGAKCTKINVRAYKTCEKG